MKVGRTQWELYISAVGNAVGMGREAKYTRNYGFVSPGVQGPSKRFLPREKLKYYTLRLGLALKLKLVMGARFALGKSPAHRAGLREALS